MTGDSGAEGLEVMTVLFLLLVLIFCLSNIAFGMFAAGFFGYGPFRSSAMVRFISNPVMEPPRCVASFCDRFARRAANSDGTSTTGG